MTGTTTFCTIELALAPGVYVPRPQTEALAMPPGGNAVDLCCGAGAIAAVISRPPRRPGGRRAHG